MAMNSTMKSSYLSLIIRLHCSLTSLDTFSLTVSRKLNVNSGLQSESQKCSMPSHQPWGSPDGNIGVATNDQCCIYFCYSPNRLHVHLLYFDRNVLEYKMHPILCRCSDVFQSRLQRAKNIHMEVDDFPSQFSSREAISALEMTLNEHFLTALPFQFPLPSGEKLS